MNAIANNINLHTNKASKDTDNAIIAAKARLVEKQKELNRLIESRNYYKNRLKMFLDERERLVNSVANQTSSTILGRSQGPGGGSHGLNNTSRTVTVTNLPPATNMMALNI